MAMEIFFVTFSRIGNIARNHTQPFEAKTMAALEPPITAWLTRVLGKEADQITVTVDPENRIGQIDYGLLGNFSITPASERE